MEELPHACHPAQRVGKSLNRRPEDSARGRLDLACTDTDPHAKQLRLPRSRLAYKLWKTCSPSFRTKPRR